MFLTSFRFIKIFVRSKCSTTTLLQCASCYVNWRCYQLGHRHAKSHPFCVSLKQIQLLSLIHPNYFSPLAISKILLPNTLFLFLLKRLQKFIFLTSYRRLVILANYPFISMYATFLCLTLW